jgi:two-component system, NarL family, sensor kinase
MPARSRAVSAGSNEARLIPAAARAQARDVDRGWGFTVAGLSGLAWVLGLGGLVVAAASGTVGGYDIPSPFPLILAVATNLPSAVLAVAPVAIAAGAAVGIVKYRLYDLDMLVNRALVWAALSALSAAIYVVCVGFFQRLFTDAATAGSVLATAVVAVAFQPLRLRVQHGVNRLIYGYRDQPDEVLREIARSLDGAAGSDVVLPALAAALARCLGLKGIVLDVDGGPNFSGRFGPAEPGSGQQGLLEAATARHGGTTTRILVTPRRGSSVSARDGRLLADLAPSVAMAAESARLGRALEQGRLRALATLAEEQRRVRRDLHDGLGPVLAGLRMTSAAPARSP